MSALEFALAVEPPRTTHQQKKFASVGGKIRAYEPPKLKAARALLMSEVSKHAPSEPIAGAVKVEVAFRYKKGKAHKKLHWKVTKPDLDNQLKLLFDCMTKAGFWGDDSQIAQVLAEKTWADEPGIEIKVSPLAEKPWPKLPDDQLGLFEI